MTVDTPAPSAGQPAIAYVGARLPALSETFVYRELLGLRDRGWTVLPVTIYRPAVQEDDARLAALAREAIQVYAGPTALHLPAALVAQPGQMWRALRDAFTADLDGVAARAKHVVQAWMGLAMARRLAGRGIGHVHAHLANTPATVGLYLARGLGASFSFTGHAADLFVNRRALAFKLAHADFTIAISRWHRDFYDRVVPADAATRPVIRCSVALPDYAPSQGRDIVSVGRLVAKKGFDLLIRAFARLDHPTLRLRIAGDGPEREALLALAREEGIADRVDLLGARPHAECLDLIASAAIFALPCRTSRSGDRDGIPVVLMEAMAAGKPVVAGRLETIAELVEDDVSGALVAPDDVEALAAALDRLAANPDLRRTMGLAGHARIAEEFSDAVNQPRLEAAIEGALGQRARR